MPVILLATPQNYNSGRCIQGQQGTVRKPKNSTTWVYNIRVCCAESRSWGDIKSHPLDCRAKSDLRPSQRNPQSRSIKRLKQILRRLYTGNRRRRRRSRRVTSRYNPLTLANKISDSYVWLAENKLQKAPLSIMCSFPSLFNHISSVGSSFSTIIE